MSQHAVISASTGESIRASTKPFAQSSQVFGSPASQTGVAAFPDIRVFEL